MSKINTYSTLKNQLIINAANFILNLWFSTCRVTIEGQKYHDVYIRGNQKIIGATWHRGAIFLVWFFRKARPMIMFSQSRDGELLAGFAQKMGIRAIRGSSSKGGRQALDGMSQYLKRTGNRKAATVLDGPTGPAYIAKKGMIVLSKETGVPVLPIMVSACPAFTFKKSWDKTMIPLPFSKVTVSYEKPLKVPSGLGDQGVEECRQKIETILNDMRRLSDRQTGYNGG